MPKIFVKFQPLLGGHSGAKITNYEDLNQKQIDPIRFQELVEQYNNMNQDKNETLTFLIFFGKAHAHAHAP